ncbi:hypothetical protein [Streptomyces inhibens]|uniref:hypothetical protein n=1 Tax=Streptomyces inhibens TaxID=2293571 RepID=UPI001EE69C61|nr:hypothetical protein [Streptomyces inhibens]UKY48576.1 hypothetical protein KI385_07050 [Streptomyces inhibens]
MNCSSYSQPGPAPAPPATATYPQQHQPDQALLAAARQAALINSPAQRLAQQVVEKLKLIDSPTQRLAQKMAADHLKLIDSSLQRVARQMAVSMPKLDIAADLHQPRRRDEALDDDVDQSDPADGQAGSTAETDDTSADDDNAPE